jgi:hypothetical protein
MSFETVSPTAHLRAARAHLREASVAIDDTESRLSPSLARLVAQLDGLVGRADTAPVEAPEPGTLETTLDVLDDEGCRSILAVTGTDALTVSEIRDACDIPRSTVYRKIDRLSETPLLTEDVRIGSRGPHAHEYRRTVDDVLVSLGPAPKVTLGSDPLTAGLGSGPAGPLSLDASTGRYGASALDRTGVGDLSDGSSLSLPDTPAGVAGSVQRDGSSASDGSDPVAVGERTAASAVALSPTLDAVDIPAGSLRTVLSTDGSDADGD